MEIKIHTQHLDLSEAQEEKIRNKVAKLATYAHKIADEASTIRVDLSYTATKNPDEAYMCALTLFVPQDTLRAESHNGTLETVVDDVIEKIKPPIERYKDKIHHISERH